MSFQCCLSVAYILHIDITVAWHVIFCVLVFISPSYLCNQFVILIFILSDHIISFKQNTCFFGHFCQNFSFTVLFSFCLIFLSNLSLALLINVLPIKKACIWKVVACKNGVLPKFHKVLMKSPVEHLSCLCAHFGHMTKIKTSLNILLGINSLMLHLLMTFYVKDCVQMLRHKYCFSFKTYSFWLMRLLIKMLESEKFIMHLSVAS